MANNIYDTRFQAGIGNNNPAEQPITQQNAQNPAFANFQNNNFQNNFQQGGMHNNNPFGQGMNNNNNYGGQFGGGMNGNQFGGGMNRNIPFGGRMNNQGIQQNNYNNNLQNALNNMPNHSNIFNNLVNQTGSGGEPEDSTIKLIISDNHLEARIMVVSPKFGGKDITKEQIEEALAKERITNGINYEMIDNIVNEHMYDTFFTIAHGEPAINGTDGYIDAKYDTVKKYKPKILKDGSVDYRDLGAVVNINKGDVIAEIHHETIGQDGMDIYGIPIVALSGKAPAIPQGVNTGLSGDGSYLLAFASGNLVYENEKFCVNTVFTVNQDVDISIGNINFMGDVIVKGNVEEGFQIISGSNITVMGMINSALLQADNDIVVKNGAINSTIISNKGNITVGFGENSVLKCKGNCKGNSFVTCNADVEGELTCDGRPGAIVGGTYRVMGNLSCNTLGHKNYIETFVYVGNFAALNEELHKLKDVIAEIDEDVRKINISLTYLKKEKEKLGKLDKAKEDFVINAVRYKVQKMLEKKPLEQRMKEIDSIVGQSEMLSIKVAKVMYPNVRINMGSFALHNREEYSHCIVRTGKQGIEIGIL